MIRAIYDLRFATYGLLICSFLVAPGGAQTATNTPSLPRIDTASLDLPQVTNNAVYSIDLPTTLRLAGARNLDIQIARQDLDEADAERQRALEQFFPWIAPGVSYHRRDGLAQSVPSGVISSAHFQSYSPGVALTAQMALGDALYNSLAAKQRVKASDLALETQRQDTILSAARGYFDLVKARALVEVAGQAVQISQDYQRELHDAVAAGIAFKGDELRVQTQTEQNKIVQQQALEQQRVAAVNLAQVLHLDSRVDLAPLDLGVSAFKLFPTNASVSELVVQALGSRPELKESQALLAALRADKSGAVYGPLIPSIGAQAFGGGLGGGPDGGPSTFGAEGDYGIGLNWKIGPGGLFDQGRLNGSKARVAAAQLSDEKLKDTILGQVVASLVRVNSTAAQIELAQGNLQTANDTLRLTRERKQYGVGVVLEDIQAQQALTRARSDFATAVAESDKAQYALKRAIGALR